MTGRGDKVEESVNSIVTEAGITLDTGLFSKNIIVLTLDVAGNFTETAKVSQYGNRPSVY
jgi:hypothetical protein